MDTALDESDETVLVLCLRRGLERGWEGFGSPGLGGGVRVPEGLEVSSDVFLRAMLPCVWDILPPSCPVSPLGH